MRWRGSDSKTFDGVFCCFEHDTTPGAVPQTQAPLAQRTGQRVVATGTDNSGIWCGVGTAPQPLFSRSCGRIDARAVPWRT